MVQGATGGVSGHFSSVPIRGGTLEICVGTEALGRVSLKPLLEEAVAKLGDLQRAENPAGAIGLSQRDKPEIQTETHAS